LISSFIKSNQKSNRALSRLKQHPLLWIDKMPVKDKPTTPRFRPFNNIFLILGVIFLVANFIVPSLLGPQVPAVPYSLFIHQVQEGQVDRVQIAETQIRYQLKPDASPGLDGEEESGAQVLSTTPIFDLGLPKLLEEQGVEFAAAPPPQNGWIGSVLSWVIPPLIFVGIWQFFIRRGSWCWRWSPRDAVHWQKQSQGLCRRGSC
jgi:cell division protease FtsH